MKKRLLALFMILSLLVIPNTFINAATAYDTNTTEAIQRMADLGIFSTSDITKFNPTANVTKEEFSKIMVIASGLSDEIFGYSTSLYSDVPASRWSNNYINLAVSENFVTSELDGYFKPTLPINYAQVLTTLLTSLGYSTSSLTGTWPSNVITKAKEIGLVTTESLSAGSNVPRYIMAQLIDKFMFLDSKDSDNIYAVQSGYYESGTVEDITKSLSTPVVVTSSGTFTLTDGLSTPEIGDVIVYVAKGSVIQKYTTIPYTYNTYSVYSSEKTDFISNDGKTVVLPKNISYYYDGSTIAASGVYDILDLNSTVVVAMNGNTPISGIIVDPVYGTGAVVTTDHPLSDIIGIDYRSEKFIKAGELVSYDQIEDNDVVYNVTDLYGNNSFYVIVEDVVYGTIQNILPSQLSPTAIEINDQTYTLGDDFPKSKIINSDVIDVGTYVSLVLDVDGKVANILKTDLSDNSNYAYVVKAYLTSTTKDSSNTYYVDLLHTDGSVETYETSESAMHLGSNLVTYTVSNTNDEYDRVTLIPVMTSLEQTFTVDQYNNMIDDDYISDNAVIFNVVDESLDTDYKNDVSVISWSSIPSATYQKGKITYLHHTGAFNDIDVIVTDNIFDENVSNAIITSTATNGGTTYSSYLTDSDSIASITTQDYSPEIGDVLKVNFKSNGNIDSVVSQYESSVDALINKHISAIEYSRIKVSDNIHQVSPDVKVYRQTSASTYTEVSWSTLMQNYSNYSSVDIFFNNEISYGGKVNMIILY